MVTNIFKFWGNASYKYFTPDLKNDFRTSMDFYYANPVGRIMNRFTKDIETIDNITIIKFDASKFFGSLFGALLYHQRLFPFNCSKKISDRFITFKSPFAITLSKL